MATISTPHYLLDQAKRRFTPSFNNFPGMSAVERRLLNTEWTPRKLADPPPGSGLPLRRVATHFRGEEVAG